MLAVTAARATATGQHWWRGPQEDPDQLLPKAGWFQPQIKLAMAFFFFFSSQKVDNVDLGNEN